LALETWVWVTAAALSALEQRQCDEGDEEEKQALGDANASP